MHQRLSLGVALSLCLAACFARTTSLGSATNGSDGNDGGTAASDGGSATVDGPTPDSGFVGSLGHGAACQIGADGHPVVPCNNGELGVGREYCKSDNGTCGGSAHCTELPPPTPGACLSLECGCDKKLRCNGVAPFDGVDIAPAGYCALPCGTHTCDATKEFCWHGSGGPAVMDAATETYECKPVPTECATTHTCQCLLAHSGSAGPCTDTGGYLDLQVFLP